MSKKIEITKDMMLAARDYIPNAEKEAFVAECATKCFDKLAITGTDGEPAPDMYMVNSGLKARHLMGALIGLYFGQADWGLQVSEDDQWLIPEELYDLWAGSHALNQIERWKRDAELRDKCYDMLADYKDLEKRLSAQINGLLTVMNDPVLRQNEYMAAQVKQMPELLKQINELQGKVEDHGD